MLVMVLVVGAVLAAVLISSIKPSIYEADYNDLMAVDGIGEVLSYRIIDYLNTHPNYTIDDLIYVDGIGEVKLKALKGVFR